MSRDISKPCEERFWRSRDISKRSIVAIFDVNLRLEPLFVAIFDVNPRLGTLFTGLGEVPGHLGALRVLPGELSAGADGRGERPSSYQGTARRKSTSACETGPVKCASSRPLRPITSVIASPGNRNCPVTPIRAFV